MTNPKFSTLYCGICGCIVGSKPGESVVLGLQCADPLCTFTGLAGIEDTRNSLIVASVWSGIPVQTVAKGFGVTRQRVYQIEKGWRLGH